MGKIIAESVLFVLGVVMVLLPNAMVRFQVWTQRVLMKAQFIPSKRTYMAMRLIGVLLAVLALLIFIGVLK